MVWPWKRAGGMESEVRSRKGPGLLFEMRETSSVGALRWRANWGKGVRAGGGASGQVGEGVSDGG